MTRRRRHWRRSGTTTDGLVPAIAQDVDGTVLMMAWMNAETLRLTFDEGRMVYWSRSRQEVWRKGDTSGDCRRSREAYYDCDADVLLFKVVQHGRGACHTGRVLVLLPAVRGRRCGCGRARDEFRALARDYTVVPVWAELLADLETPVAAYAKLVGDAPGFLLESVEHGERWSRFSFVGRDPVATLDPARRAGRGTRRAPGAAVHRPRDPRRARASWWRRTGRRRSPSCPRCTAG